MFLLSYVEYGSVTSGLPISVIGQSRKHYENAWFVKVLFLLRNTVILKNCVAICLKMRVINIICKRLKQYLQIIREKFRFYKKLVSQYILDCNYELHIFVTL